MIDDEGIEYLMRPDAYNQRGVQTRNAKNEIILSTYFLEKRCPARTKQNSPKFCR